MKRKIPVSMIKFFNVAFMVIPFWIIWITYYEPLTKTVGSKQVTTLVMLVYIIFFYDFASNLDGLRFSIRRI